MITNVLIILIIVVALLLVLIIMVQNPKGGGLSSTFGGGGGASMGGVQSTNTFLDKSTWTLAALMIGMILLTNLLLKPNNKATNDSSVKGTIEQRELIEETPATDTTAPATPTEGTENKE